MKIQYPTISNNPISAEIIADSYNGLFDDRITSFVLHFPRIVLSEFNTHCVLARNSASSRAVPHEKMLKMVKENPFIPIAFMKNHSGMQGVEYFEDEIDIEAMRQIWLEHRKHAIATTESMNGYKGGVSKQVSNRLLEPFMYHTCIVTATQYDNFFALRTANGAEIHIRDLAGKMLVEYNNSDYDMIARNSSAWHIPFGDRMDENRLLEIFSPNEVYSKDAMNKEFEELKVNIATARCARVSYINYEGKDDYKKDLELCQRLKSLGHMSPFEHCARTMTEEEYMNNYIQKIVNENYVEDNINDFEIGKSEVIGDKGNDVIVREYGWCAKFRGFIQYRKMLPGENITNFDGIKINR